MPVTQQFKRWQASAALIAAVIATPLAAHADNMFEVPGDSGQYAVKVHSFSEMRFDHVVHQKMDFSCGSATLATLLSYYYDMPVDESSILEAMYENGDKEKIRKTGFSMLDMKSYLASLGIHAEGYRAPLDKLAHVGIPAIVLINRRGYTHFVAITGVTRDRVMVADPAQGMVVYNRTDFEKMWNNILFVMLDLKDVARKHFNSRTQWASRSHTFNPDTANVMQDISSMTLNTARTPNYY